MIKDIKEIMGITFMIIVGIIILASLANSLPGEIAKQFSGLGVVLLILAGLAGIFTIISNWINK